MKSIKEKIEAAKGAMQIIHYITSSGGYYLNNSGHVSYPHDSTAWREFIFVVPGDVEIKRCNDRNIITILAERNCYSSNGSGWRRGKTTFSNKDNREFFESAKASAEKLGLELPDFLASRE